MVAGTLLDSPARRSRTVPFVVAGTVCVVAGGLVAAVTGPTDWAHGSWVAAYLVLVSGVAQIGFGGGQAILAPTVPDRRLVTLECLAWNAGSLVVIGGTLLEAPALVSLGGLVLLAGLVLLTLGVRGRSGAGGWPLWAYRVLLIILVVSTPIGLTLSWIRHG